MGKDLRFALRSLLRTPGFTLASYVEVLECVVMSSDARKFEKSFPADKDVMVGQGRGD